MLEDFGILKGLYASYFIIIVYVDWSRINKWKKLNWKVQCKQKLKIQAPIFSSGENVAIAMTVIRQKGKSRFSECFFIIWFLQSAKLHKTRIGHSCWFMTEFCGHVMVSMRLFGMLWLGNRLRTSFPIICPWKSIQNQQNLKNRIYKL